VIAAATAPLAARGHGARTFALASPKTNSTFVPRSDPWILLWLAAQVDLHGSRDFVAVVDQIGVGHFADVPFQNEHAQDNRRHHKQRSRRAR